MAPATPAPIPQTNVAAPDKPEPQRPPPTKITSPEDVKKITSQIAELIAPFTIEDIRNGFTNQPDLWNQPKGGGLSNFNGRIVNGQQVGSFAVNTDTGTIVTLTMTKARQPSGKVSVEIGIKGGNIQGIQFKLLPEGGGFQAIWNAQPVVVLSKPITPTPSNGIGFEIVEIRQGDATTQYELP
jgi:hypothetical protein